MKIVALNGMLGYGYDENALYKAFEEKVDYIGVDAGSTDPGPYYLGSGASFTDSSAVKRDLSIALPLAVKHNVPMIIGTAGGAGSAAHVEWLKGIVLEIAEEQKLHFSLGLIYTDVKKEYVIEKLRAGDVMPMGPQLDLTADEISESVRIVSQIGVAPIIKLLEQNIQVILAGRACDTAIYAAPCIMKGCDPGLAFHMAKIMECGAMCSEPVAAADVMQAYIEKDYFELRPANPIRRCTVDRVAAHTMYEQTNPYMIYEPDGAVDLRETVYTQIDGRTVRVSGSKFTEAADKTLKIEGVKLSGYRTVCISGINDPVTASKIGELIETVTSFIAQNMSEHQSGRDYILDFKRYGGNPDMGLVIDVVGKTKEISKTICALARSRLLHCDYKGRKSTAGNLAFPFSPSDIYVGEIYEFNIYHLVKADDLSETAVYEIIKVGEGI